MRDEVQPKHARRKLHLGLELHELGCQVRFEGSKYNRVHQLQVLDRSYAFHVHLFDEASDMR